jgi:long-chain acyl-CoA synthetase
MFRDGILKGVEKGTSGQQTAFHKFFDIATERSYLIEGGGEVTVQMEAACKKGDELVFSKIREELGLDRLRFFVSGGAPLSTSTARFFTILGLEVVEGYGLTETTALVTVNRPGFVRHGTVGPLVKGMEMRLSEAGEILVRGGGVMKGYWNNVAETARSIAPEGWFGTGDVGEVDAEGYLRIKGRLKEIIVLSTGKNVAPLPIEECLKESPYISQLILTGDNRSLITALIVPDFESVRDWLKEKHGSEAGSYEAAAENPLVKGLIREEIKKFSDGLADFERVKRFALLKKSFAVEDGELTPTMKVRRKFVCEKYAEVIESLYR